MTHAEFTFLRQNPSLWPPLLFNWDISDAAHEKTIDPPTGLALLIEPRLKEPVKPVLRLGWAELADLDRVLSPHSTQAHVQDFWERGDPYKFAGLIEHLAAGRPISPPLLKVVESGHIFLAGGHHRYAIARVVGVTELPFYVYAKVQPQVAGILRARWASEA